MDDRHRAKLRRHLDVIDDGVAPVVAAYKEHIQCQRGCSDCCHQTFRVSEIEGALLREGLALLPAEQQDAVRQRAAAYRPDTRMPCPLLGKDGACSAYAHRPRICRKYGIVLWDPERPERVTTCPKNFQNMPDIDPKLVLEPQAEWARDWIRLRDDLQLADAPRATIADHLLG